MVWVYFVLCILVILFAGRRLAIAADVISEKTGLGGGWIGAILTAIATSLPELFTGISSVTLVGAPDLTVGNLLGANTYNLSNLALLDILGRGALLRSHSPVHRFTALAALAIVSMVGIAIAVSLIAPGGGIGWVGWYTPVLFVMYLLIARRLFHVERAQTSLQEQEELMVEKYGHLTVRKAYLNFATSAAMIIAAGVALAIIGDEVAELTGLGENFVGAIFLAFATTLPEITVSYSAMRIGAVDLARANLAGSSIFNMVIVGIDDVFYLKAPLLSAISPRHLVTVITLLLMLGMLLYVASKPSVSRRVHWWSLATLGLFVAHALVSFSLS